MYLNIHRSFTEPVRVKGFIQYDTQRLNVTRGNVHSLSFCFLFLFYSFPGQTIFRGTNLFKKYTFLNIEKVCIN